MVRTAPPAGNSNAMAETLRGDQGVPELEKKRANRGTIVGYTFI